MKFLISIVAVILVVIMAFGALSSLTESVGSGAGGGSSTTTATTTSESSGVSNPDSSVTVDGNLTVYNYFYNVGDSSAQTQLANYSLGTCLDYTTGEESNRIFMGCATYKDSEALIAFAFDSLEIGKTYLIQFYHTTDILDSTFWYRFGDSGNFISFDITSTRDNYHTLKFKATSTVFQLGVLHFPEIPSSETFTVFGDEIKSDVIIEFFEVTE